MLVRFYTFTKKLNSTARPTGTYTEYDCVIKTSSDVITPTIELQMGLTTNPSAFNYCYIPDYNRYYWVKDWTFFNHIWIATLNVDVLATWKPYIGNTDMYVYRSSTSYDGSIIDNKYPTSSNINYQVVDIASVGKKFTDGYFVLGVYGSNAGNTVSYCSFSASEFETFIDRIYATGVQDDQFWSGLGKGIRNAIFDISSYIKSCRWYPVDCGAGITQTDMYVGGLHVTNISFKFISQSNNGTTTSVTGGPVTIPKHPQASARGAYCNLTPYSKYKLIYLPFGTFELNPLLMQNKNLLTCSVGIDAISGLATLRVWAVEDVNDTNPTTLITASTQYGVDIPISIATVNASAGMQKLGRGASVFTNTSITGGLGSIIGAVETAIPDLDSILNNAGGLALIDYTHNGLEATFYQLVDEDNDCNGRPLYKVKKPSALGGYIEGEAGTFSAPATIDEMEDVKRFIENGFYYE